MNNTFFRKSFSENIFSKPQKLEDLAHGIESTNKLRVKRTYDVLLALLAIIFICSWMFPLIAVIIKITSNGQIIFKQLRHGKDNVPFYCYKFRTMVLNNEADILQASKNDPRITKFGAFLRRSSLDELPQLFNVLKGEMSIVGPRPHAAPMNEVFSKEIPDYMNRHRMKPGITGLAQSKGFRGEIINFHDLYSRYRLDLFYIKNWCLYFDLKIILLTAYSMLFKNKRAY
ncbi:MAG: sugar transferase [Anditalea sp.]